jgi:hypothetical protein
LVYGCLDVLLSQVIEMTALGGIGFGSLAYAGFAPAPAIHSIQTPNGREPKV